MKNEIGKQIKLLRVAADLNQADLAAKAGVTRVQIGRMERGEANFSIDHLCSIAEALGHDLLISFNPKNQPVS